MMKKLGIHWNILKGKVCLSMSLEIVGWLEWQQQEREICSDFESRYCSHVYLLMKTIALEKILWKRLLKRDFRVRNVIFTLHPSVKLRLNEFSF